MRPLKIKTLNFLPFLGERELDFTNVHQAIIHGPNGIGKSSFFIDTILFALQGSARKRPEGLINDQADNCKVEFTFEHRGNVYEVTRIAARDKPNVLKIFQGNNDLTERLLTNTQKRLDSILGFSPELLLSTAVSPQDEINSLCRMPPAERERIFSEMLTLGIWEGKRKAINKRLLTLRDNDNLIADAVMRHEKLQTQLVDVNSTIILNEDKLIAIGEELDLLDTHKRPVLEEQVAAIKKEEQVRAQLDNRVKQRNSLVQELVLLKSIRDAVAIKTELLLTERQLTITEDADTPKREQIIALEERIADTKLLLQAAQERRDQIQTSLASLAQQEVKLKTYLGQIPQTLIMQEVPCAKYPDINEACKLLAHARKARDTIAKFVSDNNWQTLEHGAHSIEHAQLMLTTDIKLYEASCTDLPRQITTDEYEIKCLKQQEITVLEQLRSKIRALTIELSTCTRKETLLLQVEGLEEEIKGFEYSLVALEVTNKDNLLATYQDCISRIKALEKEYNQLEGVNQGLASKIDLLHSEVASTLESLNYLRKEQEKIAVYRTLHSAYEDIPSLLFTEMMPQVETYANEVLERIAPGRRLMLRPFKETKSETIKRTLDIISTTSTGTREFDELSGSEKFRQSLAIRIALSRLASEVYGAPINLFIIDEGFGSLDANNTQLVKHTLRRIAPLFDLFLVITHVDDLKDTFRTLITVDTNKINVHDQEISSEVPIDE